MNNISDLYSDRKLGAVYNEKYCEFAVWSPNAQKVTLNLFKSGTGDCLVAEYTMSMDKDGVWSVTVNDNLDGTYYTYSVTINDKTNEVTDIYAKACGVNGKRGMVVDMSKTNPDGFLTTKRPDFRKITDAVLYELHVRDFSVDNSSGCNYKGKFKAFTENVTVNNSGDKTCMTHLKELGVTHVHLLPSFDYATVDESACETPQFNWGYDPENYNIPEGSYSTDPFNGEVRIKEFKEMVKYLHKNGIRVVMDVVYNHTYKTDDSYFNLTVPDYYYRRNENGFTNGSGCGNETASDHKMFQKFMIDSLTFWAEEYKIDGFRFDLMAVHDIDTMNKIRHALNEIDKSIIIYGEGWTGGPSALPDDMQAKKYNADKMPDIAFFSDDIRDAIKGSVFNHEEKGFVNGASDFEDRLKRGIVASTDYFDNNGWALSPCQSINYCEAHDNLTLWDKLYYSCKAESEETRIKMDKLCAAIVFLSQGVPFIQAGQEFLRSKPVDDSYTEFEENSYKSSDFVNSIKWDGKTKYKDVFNYYKGLIALRKSENLFRMSSTQEIKDKLQFIEVNNKNLVAFKLHDEFKELVVIFNANKDDVTINIGKSSWNVLVNKDFAGIEKLDTINYEEVTVPPISCMVLERI